VCISSWRNPIIQTLSFPHRPKNSARPYELIDTYETFRCKEIDSPNEKAMKIIRGQAKSLEHIEVSLTSSLLRLGNAYLFPLPTIRVERLQMLSSLWFVTAKDQFYGPSRIFWGHGPTLEEMGEENDNKNDLLRRAAETRKALGDKELISLSIVEVAWISHLV